MVAFMHGAVDAGRAQNHNHLFAVNLLNVCARQIVRRELVVVAHHILENAVNLFDWHMLNWMNRHACFLVQVNAHEDVATAQVVKVVGKSTDTVIMLSGFQPFLNSMRLDSIFCLLSRSVMLIGSAIFLLTCF